MPQKPYDPQMTKYPLPQLTDGHYLVVKKDDGTVFDKNYPYLDKSKKFKRRFNLFRAVINCIGIPVMSIRTKLKIEGRENIKKNKELFKNGVISVVNHVHIWDFIGILKAVRPFRPRIPTWAKNCRGENKTMIKYAGGIPVPEGDIRASLAFSKAIEEVLNEGGWVHFSAEGSMWEFYQPIRPFKKGAFRFSVKTGKPVLPMAYSFRKPRGLEKIFHKNPLLTLRIGEPIFPDMTIPTPEAIQKITEQAHAAVCRLAGIEPSENVYPPVYDNSKRVDYYDHPNAVPLDCE